MRTISLVLLSILIAACAARQRAPASLPSKATPEGAMAASAPAGTTTSASAAPVADHPADKSNVPDPNILKHGYKAVHLNGQLRYCRSQILTGTHFQNTVCLTETQV